MLQMLQPGGTAVLVTEVVSSDSCQALLTIPEANLPHLIVQEVNKKNFFTGTNPTALLKFLQTDAIIAGQISKIDFSQPWLWQFFERTYAVYGVTLRKKFET